MAHVLLIIMQLEKKSAGAALKTIVSVFLVLIGFAVLADAQRRRTVIQVGTMLDGRGHVVKNTRIVIRGSKIIAIDPKATPVNYDLTPYTVLPGWIDAHVHLTWSFGPDGKNAGAGVTTLFALEQAKLNAKNTLLAGFTTVQSVGSQLDIRLRTALAKGASYGPRILTSLEPLMGRGQETGTPREIRELIRKQKRAGANVIKIFAANSVRRPEPTFSQEQLNAACDEAKLQGLRTLVHAYKDVVRMATLAGCTQIEHGVLASEEDLGLMAQKGVWLDPQAGLVLENYLLNQDKFVGTPGFPETVFPIVKELIPVYREFFARAYRIPNLKIVFGSDALAGSHGRNAEEFIIRIRDGGMDPMRAMVSANSLAAEALGMANQIGSIAPGLQADIIALEGDPLKDITVVRQVMFVMKGGVVYKRP